MLEPGQQEQNQEHRGSTPRLGYIHDMHRRLLLPLLLIAGTAPVSLPPPGTGDPARIEPPLPS